MVQTLAAHTREALEAGGFSWLVIAGGVSANGRLREVMASMTEELGVRLVLPDWAYCTDNAAMVASAGYYAWKAGRRAGLDLNADPMAELEEVRHFEGR